MGVVKDICIDGEHAYKIEQPIHDTKPTTHIPIKQPSAFAKFKHQLWQDVVSSFWKCFAYSLAIYYLLPVVLQSEANTHGQGINGRSVYSRELSELQKVTKRNRHFPT